ncbi:MAG: PhzF family phenazine biosynthesis protein [Planctomycetota bacterium]
MGRVQIFGVDAFASGPFRGNPAAVCLLDAPRDDAWLQQVAAEMNLSETAFLLRTAAGWRLRWFRPVCVVELCGHAPHASAHTLFEQEAADGSVEFHTLSGTLTCVQVGDRIEMDFPATPAHEACDPPDVGFDVLEAARNDYDMLLVLPGERAVRDCKPDFARLAQIDARGLIVTARGSDYDFVSRFFGPRVGVDEDPVTGSAHCTLAPYWAAQLGKTSMRAYQASGRGGEVSVKLQENRVVLGGTAHTVWRGELAI